NAGVVRLERPVLAPDDMGRDRARHFAVCACLASGRRDRSLGSLPLAGHGGAGLFFLSFGCVAFGYGVRCHSPDALGRASFIRDPATPNGDLAVPFSDLSIDAGIRRREAVKRRSHLAEFHGIELSLRDAASADTAGMVHPSLAGICSEDVG